MASFHRPWRDHFNRLTLLAAALLLSALAGQAATPTPHLNLILVIADDLGWADLGCYGSSFHRTPHLDQLARDGVRFTDAYSACTVCSPTRASLLTGKYPARLQLTDWIAGHERPDAPLHIPNWRKHLSTNEWNLARCFHAAGYATAAIGKWHLGDSNHYPDKQGFDLNRGGTDKGQPPRYVAPYGIPTLSDGPKGEFLTDREAAEACRFIEEHPKQPFFLYLAHYAVHQPIAGKPEVVERYRRAASENNPQHNADYAALLESVDDSLGRIRETLIRTGQASNTIVVFTSDNGGLVLGGAKAPTSNDPLRSGKGSPYEGGVRVPLIIHAPGITSRGQVVSVPTITPDLYPTLLDLAGVTDAPQHVRDGQSLLPWLRGREGSGPNALYWHYPHYHPGGATPYGAIRKGPYKLIEYFETGRVELFDLEKDLGETKDLAAAKPALAQRLKRDLASWRKRVDAQMPTRRSEMR